MNLSPNHRTALTALGLSAWLVSGAQAVLCNVPSAPYPTVGAAVRDGACTVVQLGAGSFPENVAISRNLAIQGAGSSASTLRGNFTVSGAGSHLTLNALLIDGAGAGVAGCWPQVLAAVGGATLTSGADVRVLQSSAVGSPCRVFTDGFDSGGSLAWSLRVP